MKSSPTSATDSSRAPIRKWDMSTEFSAISCQTDPILRLMRRHSTGVAGRASGMLHDGPIAGSGWYQAKRCPFLIAVSYVRSLALRFVRSA